MLITVLVTSTNYQCDPDLGIPVVCPRGMRAAHARVCVHSERLHTLFFFACPDYSLKGGGRERGGERLNITISRLFSTLAVCGKMVCELGGFLRVETA